MAVLATKFAAALFVLATGTVTSEVGCDCEATCGQLVAHLKQKVAQLQNENAQLQAENKELRAGPNRELQVATAQHNAVPENSDPKCTTARVVITNSVQAGAAAYCQSMKAVVFKDDGFHIWDVPAEMELETADHLEITAIHRLTTLVDLRLKRLTRVKGDVWIHGNSQFDPTERGLVSLDGLQTLTTVDGSLTIENNAFLETLDGLQGLVSVGRLNIWGNERLVEVTAAQKLTSIPYLDIHANRNLRSLLGLGSLTRAGTIQIRSNAELPSLAGLENVASVTGKIVIEENEALSSITGLRGLQIVRDLRLSENSALGSLNGLEGVDTVVSELWVGGGPVDSLHGLRGLTSVGGLTFGSLPNLRSLAGLENLATAGWIDIESSSLRSLTGLGLNYVGELTVHGPMQMEFLGWPFAQGGSADRVLISQSARPSCFTPHERIALVSAVQNEEASSIPFSEMSTTSGSCPPANFPTVSCTKGKPCTFSLPGEESIFISTPFSGCGACWEDLPRRNITGDGMVDFGYELKDKEGGLRSICRCGGVGEDAPVTQFLLRGPRQGIVKVCARGHNCTVSVEGELEPTDDMVLMPKCNEGEPLSAASWTAPNEFLFHDPATWYKVVPSQYQLCWRAPCTAAANDASCSYFRVKDVHLFGVFPFDVEVVLGEEDLAVPNIGFGVSDGDRMRLRRVCGEANEWESAGFLEAVSTEGWFRFDELAKMYFQPGVHRLCWCQARDGVNCDAESHFMADSGEVRFLCPRGREPASSLRRCRKCRAGTEQIEPALDPCTECPAGKFSRELQDCEVCPAGSAAPLTGSSACVRCFSWQVSDEQGLACALDPQKILLLTSYLLSVGAFSLMLAYVTMRRVRVEDVSLDQHHTIITTLGSHGYANFGASFPVRICKTGHPGLDNSFAKRRRVRVKDAVRLELLTEEGSHIDERLDTSMGTLSVPFPFDLYHQHWPLPSLILLPALLAATLVLGFLSVLAGMITEATLGGGAVVTVFTAAGVLRRQLPSSTPLERRRSEFAAVVAEANPNPQSCPKGPTRAVTVGKLHEALEFFRGFIRDRNAYYMDQNVFQPLTRPSQLSYAEWVGCAQVDWFVSHFWGTAFEHFCTALQAHAKGACGDRCWEEVRYWVCFCSNNQHQIAEELGAGWQESSFYITLKSGHCNGTCMVLDDKALPLTRIWCIFELLQTVKLQKDQPNFQGLLLCTASGVLNTGGGSIEVCISLARRIAEMDLEKAEASNERDKQMIKNQVTREMGSFEILNNFVAHEVHGVLEKAHRRTNEQMSAVLALLEPYCYAV